MFSAWDQGTYEVRFERKQCGLFWFCLIFLSFCIVANAYSALFPFKPHFVGCLIPGTTHHCHPFKCRMSNLGCRMSDVESRMLDVESRMSDVGCQIWDVECRISNVGCRMSDVECRISDVGCRISDVRCRISDVKCWMSDGTYKEASL